MRFDAVPPGAHRDMIAAERHTPELLSRFLMRLESTTHSDQVWRLLVNLGRWVDLPFIDFICANAYENWKKTLFIRTSYDAGWLNAANEDPEIGRWSYFRTHAMRYLTPIAVGIEYLDQYRHLPAQRVAVMQEGARRGLRAGLAIPLRQGTPPLAAQITFLGNHARRSCDAILRTHGWTLNVAAMAAHQRFMAHFQAELTERAQISDKQRELLEMIGRGLQDKQIAVALGVSVSAVRQRMGYLLRRTRLSNRAELAALAMSMGVLPDPLFGPDGQDYEIMVMMDSAPSGPGSGARPAAPRV